MKKLFTKIVYAQPLVVLGLGMLTLPVWANPIPDPDASFVSNLWWALEDFGYQYWHWILFAIAFMFLLLAVLVVLVLIRVNKEEKETIAKEPAQEETPVTRREGPPPQPKSP